MTTVKLITHFVMENLCHADRSILQGVFRVLISLVNEAFCMPNFELYTYGVTRGRTFSLIDKLL